MGSLGGKRKEGVKARLCSRCTRCDSFTRFGDISVTRSFRRVVCFAAISISIEWIKNALPFWLHWMGYRCMRVKNSSVNLHKLQFRLKRAHVTQELRIYFRFSSLDSDFDFTRGLDPRVRYIVSGVKFYFAINFIYVCFRKVNLHGR